MGNFNLNELLTADAANTHLEVRRLRRTNHGYAEVMTALNLSGIIIYPDGPKETPCGFDFMGSTEVTTRQFVAAMVVRVGLNTFESLGAALEAADGVYQGLALYHRVEAMCGAQRRWVWEDV